MHIIVEPGVDAGIMIHLAFLVDALIKGEEARTFPNLAEYVKNTSFRNRCRTHEILC